MSASELDQDRTPMKRSQRIAHDLLLPMILL
ncbi:MAG TPA: curli production assembly protein CsgB, partial [Pseudomonas sp.]|nr:curli production assembly protein CsgB [Pseudomonas sp.]